MKAVLAGTAGFCFGVKRAVDTVEEILKRENLKPERDRRRIYTYGEIVHNDTVVDRFRQAGVSIIGSKEELAGIHDAIVIIRAHGVGAVIYRMLADNHNEIIDASCPYVRKIQRLIHDHSKQGESCIIIGNPEHPEVQGIKGWAGDHVEVFQTKEEAENYSCEQGKKICIVAQTTFNYNKFKELVEILEKKSYDVSVLNTICNATKERQTEAQSIAETVDAMIVIGDKHSSNTQKLFEICRKACNNTYYIQTLGDLDLNQLGSVETVGITAGASTPNNIIEEVQNNVRIIF